MSRFLFTGFSIFALTILSLKAQRPVITDSLYAIGYMTTVKPGFEPKAKFWQGGILGGPVRLMLQKDKKNTNIVFNCQPECPVVAMGENMVKTKNGIAFPVQISPGIDYTLMVLSAADSAGSFTLYSGYAFLPDLGKWKLIGTFKMPQYALYVHPASTMEAYAKNQSGKAEFKNTWIMKRNGRWKSLEGENDQAPEINLSSHVDSAARVKVEAAIIQQRVSADMKGLTAGPKGLFYTVIEKGNGSPVLVTDTIKVFYKGYLLENGEVFDQRKPGTNPAEFPLSRLIPGWQLGVPLIHVGGKIQLVIPSHLGYNIRTRSPKIPPNSILVFEIEVLEN